MSLPVALITGASRGIGRATAVELAQSGYRLALVARKRSELEATADLANAPDAAILPADVSDPVQAQQAVDDAAVAFGQLDAVIHCAGVAPVRTIEQTTLEDWRQTIDTNLSAAFYLARAAWPHLKNRGGASVVFISSLAARDPFPGFAAYAAAKAGINLLGLALAREGLPHDVRVHTIAPGAVETAMLRTVVSEEQYPTANTMDPAEVAAVIVQCVTGQLKHTTGEVIYLHKTF